MKNIIITKAGVKAINVSRANAFKIEGKSIVFFFNNGCHKVDCVDEETAKKAFDKIVLQMTNMDVADETED